MDEWPRITVVTPSYNQAAFLRATIESVLGQGYPNLEYFIIDGGSTDGSVEIIRHYEDRLDGWVSEKDAGQADAIAKGFDRASGELLGWLNSDDVLFPGALFAIAQAYRQSPNACIFTGGVAVSESADGAIAHCLAARRVGWCARYFILPISQPGTFYNARDYRAVGGIRSDLHIHLDPELHYRLLRHRPEMVPIHQLVALFRKHDNSKSCLKYSEGENLPKQWAATESQQIFSRLRLPKWQRQAARWLYRLQRLATGEFLRDWAMSRRYRGQTATEIWNRSR